MVLYLVYSLTTDSQILVNYEKCLTEALKTEKSILTKIVVILPYIWYPYNNKKGNTTRDDVGFLWFTLYLKQGDFHYLHGKYKNIISHFCWLYMLTSTENNLCVWCYMKLSGIVHVFWLWAYHWAWIWMLWSV